jgi:RNA 3'-terminal phosphate cyclase-like protein
MKIPIVRQLKPLVLTDDGKIRRIRGIAYPLFSDSFYFSFTFVSYATKVAPTLTNRIVDSARGILNKFMQDVYIYNDHYKGSEAGKYVKIFLYFLKNYANILDP